MRLRTAVQCPACSAEGDLHADGDSFVCRFCGCQVFVDLDRGARRLLTRPRLRGNELTGVIGRHLSRREIPGQPRVMESTLTYEPVWRIEADGRAHLVPARTDLLDEYAGRHAIRAATASEVRLFRDEDVEPDAVMLEPDLRLADARATLDLEPDGPGDLLHHPVWDVTWRLVGSSWHVRLDAVTGDVWSGMFPSAPSGALDRIFGTAMAGCFALFALEGMLLPPGQALVAGAVSAVLMVPALGIWLRRRGVAVGGRMRRRRS